MSVVVVDAFYYLFCAYQTIDGDWIVVHTPDHIREAHASRIETSFLASASPPYSFDPQTSTKMQGEGALRDASRSKRKNASS